MSDDLVIDLTGSTPAIERDDGARFEVRAIGDYPDDHPGWGRLIDGLFDEDET